MPERHDTQPRSEHARRAYAVARLIGHRRRELHCLARAVDAGDDLVARRYEARADEAHLDALAVAREHEIDEEEGEEDDDDDDL